VIGDWGLGLDWEIGDWGLGRLGEWSALCTPTCSLRLQPQSRFSDRVRPVVPRRTNGSNGLGFDAKGLSCRCRPRRARRRLASSTRRKPHHRQLRRQAVRAPNDLVVSTNGGGNSPNRARTPRRTANAQFRAPPAVYFDAAVGGKPVQIATDIARPNGIMLSPTRRRCM
jgi:sugar lactone lactonase YvrE